MLLLLPLQRKGAGAAGTGVQHFPLDVVEEAEVAEEDGQEQRGGRGAAGSGGHLRHAARAGSSAPQPDVVARAREATAEGAPVPRKSPADEVMHEIRQLGGQPIESHLADGLAEALLAEVAAGTVHTTDTAASVAPDQRPPWTHGPG